MVPSITRSMQSSRNTRATCAVVRHSASLKRVFCISISGLPKAFRSFVYSTVSSTARSIAATAATATIVRSHGQLLHQLGEAATLLAAEQVRRRHAHVVEVQLRGVLAVHADLVEDAAAAEARRSASRPSAATRPWRRRPGRS